MKISAIGLATVMAVPATSAAVAEGDAKAGKGVFRKCAACHFMNKEKNKVGPHLVGIVGRAAGTVEKYKYSNAFKSIAEKKVVWDEKNLDVYLTDPLKFAKEQGGKRGKMVLKLKNAQDRADVIAYLKAEAKAK